MKYNTQNAKIKSITEKTLIVGIDVGSETHYARAFDWRNIEFSKKPFAFSNDEAGFASFKAWLEDIKEKFGKTIVLPGMEPTGHNYPYIPTGVYAEIRSLYGLQVMTQEALIRVKNRIARWLSIYFRSTKTFTGVAMQSVE